MITGRGNEIRSSSFFLLRYTVGLDTAENILIAFENTIRLSAHILIASAHALIVFLSATNKAQLREYTLLQRVLFLGRRRKTHCPPTVPGGDTLCVTAGDARRVNPWRELHSSLRHRRCRTTTTFTHASLYSLNACSATPPASEISGAAYPTGSPSLCSGITRG